MSVSNFFLIIVSFIYYKFMKQLVCIVLICFILFLGGSKASVLETTSYGLFSLFLFCFSQNSIHKNSTVKTLFPLETLGLFISKYSFDIYEFWFISSLMCLIYFSSIFHNFTIILFLSRPLFLKPKLRVQNSIDLCFLGFICSMIS